MKKIVLAGIIALSVIACSEKGTQISSFDKDSKEFYQAAIQEMDDSLKVLFKKALEEDNFNIDPAVYYEAIERSKDYYYKFPEDAYAETALNKIAAMYFQLNQEDEAAEWRETILAKYPKAENRNSLMELQMSYYGDPATFSQDKIEYYARELLKTKGLSAEKKEEYEFRLEHSDKNFEELIIMQMSGE